MQNTHHCINGLATIPGTAFLVLW